MSLEEIIEKIQTKSNAKKDMLHKKIDEIHSTYSGLITKEGAALILAKEMGVEIANNEKKRLQIKNIMPGMRNVNFVGRIFKISPVKEFSKQNGKKGKVSNLYIADSTGVTRVPLWNEQVELVEDEAIKVGDVVQIVNGMSKENIYGEVEIALGKFGSIKPVEDAEGFIGMDKINVKVFDEENSRAKISELVAGNFEVKCIITRVFKGKIVFESDVGEKFLVISCIGEDNSGEIRLVFFRDVAEKACQIPMKDLEAISPDERFEKVSSNMLGKEVVISGKVQKNKMFDQMELVVNSLSDINTLDESKRIVELLESKVGENFG